MLADTMKQVQDAERQAEDIVRDAETRAATIVEEAKAAAAESRKAAEAKAREEARAALADATRAGDAEKEAYAASVNEHLATERRQAYTRADEAVNAIIAGLV